MILFTLSSFGQKNWDDKFNGLVITKDNLIIKGYLKLSVGTIDKGTKITLSKRPNDKPQIFYTLDLKGYVYKGDTFRIIHNLQPYLDDNRIIEKAEARIAQNGKLILYEIPETYYSTIPISTGGPVGTTSMTMINKSFIYVISNTKGELIGVKKDNFNNEMHNLLLDAPDMLERIENRVLKFKDIEKIVKEYNQRFD